jgi:hypothetical protein
MGSPRDQVPSRKEVDNRENLLGASGVTPPGVLQQQRVKEISMSTRIALLAAVIALAATATIAGPALAAKGGYHASGGHGGKGDTPAVLTVSPNPAPFGAPVTISGSGFTPGPVMIRVDFSLPYDTVTADTDGNVTYVFSRPLAQGLHSVVAHQEGKGKRGWEVRAWTTFTVEP